MIDRIGCLEGSDAAWKDRMFGCWMLWKDRMLDALEGSDAARKNQMLLGRIGC
jgi:hypothetical protein